MKTINRKLWVHTVFLVTLACCNLFLVIVCHSWVAYPMAADNGRGPL